MKSHKFLVEIQYTGPLTKLQLKLVAHAIQDILQDVNSVTGLVEEGSDINDGLGVKVTCEPAN